jgi:diguanylate cyclase (GGDEF)-like protein/PAS domain S-box-containing protein
MAYELLLISIDANEANILRRALANYKVVNFNIHAALNLNAALSMLSELNFSAILLDLELAEELVLNNFETLFLAVPDVPIMVLSTKHQEKIARQAVQRGAQGFITKGVYGNYLIPQQLQTVIERKAVEEALFIEKERAEFTLNSIGDAVLSTDMLGNVTYLNQVAEQMTGWSRDEASGKPVTEVFNLLDSDTYEASPNPVVLVLRHNRVFGLQANALLVRRDGMEFEIEDTSAPIHDRRGRVTGAVTVFRDISAMNRLGRRMTYLAQHDFLTDLPNRILLKDRINQAVSRAQRDNLHPAIFFLDLDNFKQINDTLGHNIGDQVLQSVSRRLVECVRSVDTVSRQGGDEFVILVNDDLEEEDACIIAEKILFSFTKPIAIDSHNLVVSASIGISSYPVDGIDATTLVKNADTAMYHAKRSGRNNYKFFTPDMNIRAVERQNLEASLRNALSQHQLEILYQPKFSLHTGAVTGVEALLRWHCPGKGMVNSMQFMHIAEESGLIIPIGKWVMREACRQTKQWEDNGAGIVPVGVNISAPEFSQTDFVSHLESVIAETGLPAERLCIELTENMLMRHPETNMAKLVMLKKIGVQLAIDDFGTGYSNLSFLKQLPIDILKIDQSFVHEISEADANGVIASAAIAIGSSLRRHVVAEGIENREQLDFLKAKSCEEGQGFYFGQPMPGKGMEDFLRKNHPSA